jgi:hypothetical protein
LILFDLYRYCSFEKSACDAFDSVGRALRKASIGLLAQFRGPNRTGGTKECGMRNAECGGEMANMQFVVLSVHSNFLINSFISTPIMAERRKKSGFPEPNKYDVCDFFMQEKPN